MKLHLVGGRQLWLALVTGVGLCAQQGFWHLGAGERTSYYLVDQIHLKLQESRAAASRLTRYFAICAEENRSLVCYSCVVGIDFAFKPNIWKIRPQVKQLLYIEVQHSLVCL